MMFIEILDISDYRTDIACIWDWQNMDRHWLVYLGLDCE